MIAIKSARLNVVQVLLENGADLNVRDRLGNTALHHAAFQGMATIVRLLVRKGVYVNEIGHYGRVACCSTTRERSSGQNTEGGWGKFENDR